MYEQALGESNNPVDTPADILPPINFYVIIPRVTFSASPNFFLVSTSIRPLRLPSIDSFLLFAPHSHSNHHLHPTTSGVYNSTTPSALSPPAFWVLDLRYARTLRVGRTLLFTLTISLVVKSRILVNSVTLKHLVEDHYRISK